MMAVFLDKMWADRLSKIRPGSPMAPARVGLSPQATYRLRLFAGMMALCVGYVPVAAIAEDAESKPADVGATVQADQGTERILQKVTEQISLGHTLAPEGDNALATWRLMLEAGPPASPETKRALTDFVEQMRKRAADEQAAGQIVVAVDLLVFAEKASKLLQPEKVVPDSPSVAELPDAPESAARDAAPAALPTNLATYDARSAGPPAEPVPSAAPAEPERSEPGRDPTQVQPPEAIAAHAPAVPEAPSRIAITPDPAVEALRDKPAAVAPSSSATTPTPKQQAAASALVRRGDAMLAIQDVLAARLFYERAAKAGDARAAMALADTYNPTVLAQLGSVGTKPDSALAEEWYRKAAALGNRGAEARLQTLGPEAAK